MQLYSCYIQLLFLQFISTSMDDKWVRTENQSPPPGTYQSEKRLETAHSIASGNLRSTYHNSSDHEWFWHVYNICLIQSSTYVSILPGRDGPKLQNQSFSILPNTATTTAYFFELVPLGKCPRLVFCAPHYALQTPSTSDSNFGQAQPVGETRYPLRFVISLGNWGFQTTSGYVLNGATPEYSFQ